MLDRRAEAAHRLLQRVAMTGEPVEVDQRRGEVGGELDLFGSSRGLQQLPVEGHGLPDPVDVAVDVGEVEQHDREVRRSGPHGLAVRGGRHEGGSVGAFAAVQVRCLPRREGESAQPEAESVQVPGAALGVGVGGRQRLFEQGHCPAQLRSRVGGAPCASAQALGLVVQCHVDPFAVGAQLGHGCRELGVRPVEIGQVVVAVEPVAEGGGEVGAGAS